MTEERLNDLLLAWQEQHCQGHELPAAELCRDCPELAGELARRINVVRQMSLLAGAAGPTRSTLGEPGPPAAPCLLPSSVPGYEVLRELGRGGMGVVYLARQVKLDRLVALKMVLSGAHAGANDRVRFRTEALAVARLRHPNIVQIHDVGEHDGLPYFSLEFCPGGSLAQRLAGTPMPPGEAAALVERLALAMHAAHASGVVHRDLKPANVLLADDRTPKVTDFGLAKRLDEAGQTATGAVLGTPSYMAPEQAEGKKDVGPACDVYALGAILYECLTGRPPFRASTPLDTILQVVADEPVPPRRLLSAVPRDLETVCLKCLHKDPRRRYSSAEALAEDLRRFRAGEPVRARPVSRAERLWRWGRRNPVLAAALAAVLVTVGLAFTLIVRSRDEAVRLAGEMTDLASSEAAQRARADLQAAHLLHQRGHALGEQGDGAQALLWLARSLERASDIHRAGGDADAVEAARALERTVRLDLALFGRDVHHLYALRAEGGAVWAVAFSPDGRVGAAAGDRFGVRLWDPATGEPVGEPVGEPLPQPGEVKALAFSADGKALLAGGSSDGRGYARVWDVAGRRPVGPPLEAPSPVTAAALSPDGGTALTGHEGRWARLWEAATGRPIGGQLRHPAPVTAVAFSPDGAHFATGCESFDRAAAVARRWDARTRRPAGPPLPAGTVRAVAFQPGSGALLTAGDDQKAQLWDPGFGRELRSPLTHPGLIRAAAFSPDGGRVLLAGDDQTARLWHVATGTPAGAPLRHPGRVYAAAVSRDGERLVTGDERGLLRVWRPAAGLGHGPPLTTADDVYAAEYSRDGQTVVAAGFGGVVYFWDAATGKLRRRPVRRCGAVTMAVALSPDGRRLAVADTDRREVRQFDAATGTRRGPALPAGRLKALAWGHGGRTILTAGWTLYGRWPDARTEAQRWDPDTGARVGPPLRHSADVWAVSDSPDGRTVLTAGGDRKARLWDAATGAPLGDPLVHPAEVWTAVFSPDGKLILTAGRDGVARVWDAETRRLSGKVLPHSCEVRTAAFSADGTLVLTGSRDGHARLWDARTRRPVGPPLAHGGIVERVAFAPGGRTFLTAGRARAVRQWVVPQAMKGDAAQVRAWVEAATGLALDENDAVVTLDPAAWRTLRTRGGGRPGSSTAE
jgi:WD40 repeat protein